MLKHPLRQMAASMRALLAPLPVTQGEVESTGELLGVSAGKVFAIPELFEIILLHLDQDTLITKALRTCRHWNEFIMHSPALQQHLFFEPRDGQSPRMLNPILAGLFPDWFPSEKEQDRPIGASFGAQQLGKWLPRLWHNRMEAMTYKDASWRNMLPCQPPLYRMIRCTIHGGRRVENQLMTLTQPDPQQTVAPKLESGMEDSLDGYEFADDEILPEDPIRMYKLYGLVTTGSSAGGGGLATQWHFVWDQKEDFDWSKRVGDEIGNGLDEILTNALKRDGLVLFERMAHNCCPQRFHPFYNTGLICDEEENFDLVDPHYCEEGERYGYRLRAWHMGCWERG